MSVPFHLPLGEPGWVDGPASAAAYRAQVVNSEWGFAGDSVFAAFQSAGGPLAEELRKVVAPSAGVAWYDADTHLVRLQLMASTMRYLRELLPAGVPAPQRLMLGPLEWPHQGPSRVVEGGDVIGPLRGPVFVIQALCQDGFFLDPLHLFEALESLGLWALPDGVRCPLLPVDPIAGPFVLAGPSPVARGSAYLSVRGGSFDVLIHNPPPVLPASRFSALSSDAIEVEVHNLAAADEAVLRFTDLSPTTARTVPNPAAVDLPAGRRWSIVPQVVRKPTHEDYTPTHGSREPSPALMWRLRATLDGGTALTTTITQDARDVIRQEYVFHRPPFQVSPPTPPEVPQRRLIEPDVAPPFARFFTPRQMCTNNYGAGAGDWLLNSAETYRVAETLRRLFAQQLAARKVAGTLPDVVNLYGVNVKSGWRNPERNENVEGALNSNHQQGRALDLRSSHINDANKNLADYAPVRAVLHESMFRAAEAFLRALVDANSGAACASVEILLEKDAKALWVFSALADGSLRSRHGSKYSEVVGAAPPSDADLGIRTAARHASHVHVGWKPADADAPLVLPAIPDYIDIAPSPGNVFRNLILIADEHASVPADKQLPLNHVAASLKLALETVDPHTPSDIHVVATPLDFLERCNAFRDPPFKVRRLYSFSHAWPAGLVLTHHTGAVPYRQPVGTIGAEVHDEAVYDRMNFLYGDNRPSEDSQPLDPLNPFLPIGEDDLTEVKTNQLRIANLLLLPHEAVARLRVTFADADGVFLVGCRTAEQDESTRLSVAQVMADLIGRPVHGAAYYSKVFQRDDDGEWDELDLARGDAAPDHAAHPVVLVPGSLGGAQRVKYFFAHDFELPDVVAPSGDDLPALYAACLTRCDPKPVGAGESED